MTNPQLIEQGPRSTVVGAYKYIPSKPNDYSIDDTLRKFVAPKIEEPFENTLFLYHYMEVQMNLQITNDEITTFVTKRHEHILIINLGLHLKGSKNKYLYGIIVIDIHDDNTEYKHLWQINKYLSSEEIHTEFGININTKLSLPQPSKMRYFDKDFIKKDMNRFLINNDYEFRAVEGDMIRTGYKLVIDRAEWIKACRTSLNNDDLPLFPIIINNNDHYQIGYVKIISIPSKNVYVGIQFEISLLPSEFATKFKIPREIIQYIHSYSKRVTLVRDPRSICYASAATSLSKSISLAEMNKYSKKWVDDIKICDLNKELISTANKYRVDPDHVIDCFDDKSTRKSFSFSMKELGVKQGTALKIFDNLKRLGLISSLEHNPDIQLYDFSTYWVQILKQQSKWQQDIIHHSSEIISNHIINSMGHQLQHEIMRSDHNLGQQMMYHFNQAMENMHAFRDENDDRQPFMEPESHRHWVQI